MDFLTYSFQVRFTPLNYPLKYTSCMLRNLKRANLKEKKWEKIQGRVIVVNVEVSAQNLYSSKLFPLFSKRQKILL